MSSSLQFIYAELARSMLWAATRNQPAGPATSLDGFAARRVRTPRGFTMPAWRRCAPALAPATQGVMIFKKATPSNVPVDLTRIFRVV